MIDTSRKHQSSSRFHTIIHLCSFLIIIYSFTMLAPIAVALFYNDGYITPFLAHLYFLLLLVLLAGKRLFRKIKIYKNVMDSWLHAYFGLYFH